MTARKQAKRGQSARKRNPLERFSRVGRPKLGFNGQTLLSTLYGTQSAIGGVTARTGADWHVIDCSSDSGVNRAGADVIKHYQDYKYLSASFEWLPGVGPASSEAGAQIFIAYIDNPELIVTFRAATAANQFAMVRNCANVKNFNAWERFTFRVPLTYRRKTFNVDITNAGTSNEEAERSIQGLIVIAYLSIGNTVAAAGLGQCRLVSNTWLAGFTASTLT